MKTNEGVPLPASVWNRLVTDVRVAEAAAADWHGNPEKARAAHAVLPVARAALAEAIEMAPRGGNGSAFVTCGGAFHPRAVWINRRLVATLTAGGYVEVVDPSQSEEDFQAAKTAARAWEAKNEENLDEVGRLLHAYRITSLDWQDAGTRVGDWTYCSGQEGGHFERGKTTTVSARGALSRAAAIAEQPAKETFRYGGMEVKIPRRKSPWREE